MDYYLFDDCILTSGEMHVVWMRHFRNEHKNFAKWLSSQQKVS